MKKFVCLFGAFCAFFGAPVFAVGTIHSTPSDTKMNNVQDSKENLEPSDESDVFAIPVDTSAQEDEDEINRLKKEEKKLQKPTTVKK